MSFDKLASHTKIHFGKLERHNFKHTFFSTIIKSSENKTRWGTVNTNKKSRLSTNINDDLLQQFKIQAIKENKKMNELLEQIIKSYLHDQHDEKQKNEQN